MMRPNLNRPQVDCNKGVTDLNYMGRAESFSDDEICFVISKIIESVSPNHVYIGITGHPCGRFTGFYTETTPIPVTSKLPKDKNKEIEDSVTEAAHIMDFSRMHLVCSSDDIEYMKALEQRMIACSRKGYPDKVMNRGDGGEGDPKGHVYLYVAVSKMIN